MKIGKKVRWVTVLGWVLLIAVAIVVADYIRVGVARARAALEKRG